MPADVSINDVYEIFTTPWNPRIRYRVRSMHENDISIVFAIERETWGSESWSSQNFFQALNDPVYNCWILESTITDYVVLGYGLQYSRDNISHIANFCLHPNRRGRGLGGILLRHMIDFARINNASRVELEVDTSNRPAYTLYLKHGFKIVDYLPSYYSNSTDAYRMVLPFYHVA